MRKLNFGKWASEFFSGHVTSEQKSALHEWDAMDQPDERNDPSLVDAQLRIKQQIDARLDFGRRHVSLISRPVIWRAAAAIAILVAALIYIVRSNSPVPGEQVAGLYFENNSAVPVKYTLADGSVIWLNSKTRIDIAPEFNQRERKVKLRGEAFFEVAKNPEKPFIVDAGQITTRVLGTSFNVKAYDDDNLYEVSVIEGKVAVKTELPAQAQPGSVSSINGDVILSRDEKIVFQVEEKVVQKEKEDQPAAVTAWKDNRFVFDNTPVGEVFKQVERKYNVRITTSDERVLNCSLRLDISGQSLQMMMEMVCQLIDATYEQSGSEIRVTGPGCNRSEN